MSRPIPWKELNGFILSLGNIPTAVQFAEAVLSGLKEILRFDCGLAYFYDGNGKIKTSCLIDYDQRLSAAYRDYYVSLVDMHDPELFNNLGNELSETETPGLPNFGITDWSRVRQSEFVQDYIKGSELKYSINFPLFDTKGRMAVHFALDRVTERPFSAGEIEMIRFVTPHLNNLIKKYYFYERQLDRQAGRKEALMDMAGLTRREKEIAAQLCAGISPSGISLALHITPATTAKHIAHIYQKMQVTNLQELLVRLLNPQAYHEG